MGKITDAITNLFNSDKVVITDSGQKVISMEPILEEVKGLDIIDVDTGIDENVTEVTDTSELPEYANYSDYQNLVTLVNVLESRLVKLESLLEISDNLTGDTVEVNEIW